MGWSPILGNLNIVAPGMQIGGDVFQNRNGHLPIAEGRIWYEADINYDFGYRNHHRILYSNDGLIFATYDYYMTFVQVQ
ncbi:MAG: ribonuclease domain-containing protein [Ruminococcus sp.]